MNKKVMNLDPPPNFERNNPTELNLWIIELKGLRLMAPYDLDSDHQKAVDTVCERLDNIIIYLGTRV